MAVTGLVLGILAIWTGFAVYVHLNKTDEYEYEERSTTPAQDR